MPHGRGLPSGERPSRLRRDHDQRAVRPRSWPPGCRELPSDPRCRRQCILRLHPSDRPARCGPCSGVWARPGALRVVAGRPLQLPGRARAAPPRGPPARVAGEGAGGRDAPPAPPPRGGRGRRRRGRARAPPGGRTANPQGLRKCALLPAGRRAGAGLACRSTGSGQALPQGWEVGKSTTLFPANLPTSSPPSSAPGRELARPSLPPQLVGVGARGPRSVGRRRVGLVGLAGNVAVNLTPHTPEDRPLGAWGRTPSQPFSPPRPRLALRVVRRAVKGSEGQ